MAGYDTVSLLTNSFVTSADVAYGVPSFWVRYFSPSPYTTINSSKSNAVSESRAAWVSGGHYMGIVSSPGHPAASQAQGQADAQTLASAAYAYWLDVSSVYLPPNNVLYCWTDVEPGQSLGLAYWTGWSYYIDGYPWPGVNNYPLYPCLYCNPCDSGATCSTLSDASAPACFAIWSYEQQVCSGTVSNPPAWNATTCASCSSYSGVTTQLWQFRINSTSCPASVNVDQDLGGNINYANYCFDITASP